jgi:glycosyltransferase involved in cell wall biosynthesis
MSTHLRELPTAAAQPPPGPAPRDERPVRILQVVSGLERGGIEIWLMHVLQRLERSCYQMDFLLTTPSPGTYEAAFRAEGSQMIPCYARRQPLAFARGFAAALQRFGPYDVVHSHVHHYSGLIVRLAAWYRVPVRIVHSHNDTRPAEMDAGWQRRAYLRLMKGWIRRHATDRVAVSREAGEDLFGPGWEEEARCGLLYCGLDFAPFAVAEDRAAVRRLVGLPPDALVIGHVGRFFWRKNHRFLLEIAAAAMAREPRAWLLSLGDGPLQAEIAAYAGELGIAGRCVFAGMRSDVPRLLRGAMDVFVLPSHHEGLSLAQLEAQAAGLPCVLSDALTPEGDVVAGLIHRLPLTAGAEVWAQRLLEVAAAQAVSRAAAHRTMTASPFAIEKSVANLLRLYAAARAR